MCVCQFCGKGTPQKCNPPVYLVIWVTEKLNQSKTMCMWDSVNQWVNAPAVRGTEGGEGAVHKFSSASVGENNNKFFSSLKQTRSPSYPHSPLHCPSASHKSRLSSAGVPLMFRNVQVGFQALWVMGTPGRGWGRGREKGWGGVQASLYLWKAICWQPTRLID